MNVSFKRKLAALAIWPIGLGLMSAFPFASALAEDCSPISISLSCQNDPNNVHYQWAHNPMNPMSTEYQWAHNPTNPLNPDNWYDKPAYDPANSASTEYQWVYGSNPYVRQPNVLDLLGALSGAARSEPIGYPSAAEPTNPSAPALRRHHRHRKHYGHLR